MAVHLKDSSWVRQSFMVVSYDPKTNKIVPANLAAVDKQNRFFSTASLKFTDTTPGGNYAINPPAQFTRHADLKVKGRFSGSLGMGRYYSEAIDDNGQVIHLRFGVPAFNSLTQFFTGFYNTGAGQLARTGRSTGLFYELGRAAGLVVSIAAWPIMILGTALRFFLDKPSSKFYYFKPTMPLYWNAVQTMVNHLAVNRGIIPRILSSEQQKLMPGEDNSSVIAQLRSKVPDVFKANGGIDVYGMARRAGRLARKEMRMIQETLGDPDNPDYQAALQQIQKAAIVDTYPDFAQYIRNWLSASVSFVTKDSKNNVEATTEGIKMDTKTGKKVEEPGWFEQMEAEWDDASSFVSFRVNYTGPVSESFSNSTGPSEIQQKINSMSSSARSMNFNFAGGNVSDGAVGKLIGGVANAAKDFFSGMADALQISGLAALGGAAFVDIPEHWQQSTASLPHSSYTINLVSPYGNPISQMINLYIPLSMLLAGALPLATGKQSYTSPFLCQLFDKGRCQTRLGIIDSISITRGTGNFGFDNEGHAMAIDITFTVKDLSSIMYMPIVEGFALNPLDGIFDEDTVYSDYMAVIAGMNLNDQVYRFRKLGLNITRKLAQWDSFFSVSHLINWGGNTLPSRLISAAYKGTTR